MSPAWVGVILGATAVILITVERVRAVRVSQLVADVLAEPYEPCDCPDCTDAQEFYEWADATMLLFAGSDRDDELHQRRMGR